MGYGTGVGPRTAVVTGASSLKGIGFHAALRYAQEGWAVALLDINEEGLRAATKTVEEQVPDARVIGVQVDVTSPESVAAAVRTIADSGLPPVGALANIAGIPAPADFLDLTLAEWNKVIAVNLTGPFLLSQALLPACRPRTSRAAVRPASTRAACGLVRTSRASRSRSGASSSRRSLTSGSNHGVRGLPEREQKTSSCSSVTPVRSLSPWAMR